MRRLQLYIVITSMITVTLTTPSAAQQTLPTPTIAPTKSPCQKDVSDNLKRLQIEYPKELNERRTEGSVRVEVMFGSNGSIAGTKPLSGLPEFSKAVTDAVKSWQPSSDGGSATATKLELDVDFKMNPENQKPVPFPTVERREDVMIELDRTGCLGTCPVYSLRLYGDGRVEYDGNSNVFLTGKHAGRITSAEFEAVVDVFREADFFSLENQYTVHGTTIRVTAGACYVERSSESVLMDAPSALTSIKIGSASKQVDDEQDAPESLRALEKAIDRYSVQWSRGNSRSVPELLAERHGVNRTNSEGWSPLLSATVHADDSLVEDLIHAGADVNFRGPDGITPLMIAARRRNLGMVLALSHAGANIRATDRNGNDALVYAATGGNEKIVKIFIDAGADVNAKNKDEDTPLIAASRWGNPAVVKLLLDKNARPNDRDKDGNTALIEGAGGNKFHHSRTSHLGSLPYFASDQPDRPAVARILIAAGAKISASSEYGDTVFSEATEDVLRELLKDGAGVNAPDEDGDVPLAKVRTPGEAEFLIESGAEVDRVDSNGRTPLMSAAGQSILNTVGVLVGAGAQIDHQDKDGQTALMEAVAWAHSDNVKNLLRLHANVNLKNKKGETALKIAERNLRDRKRRVYKSEYTDIIKLLVDAGGVV